MNAFCSIPAAPWVDWSRRTNDGGVWASAAANRPRGQSRPRGSALSRRRWLWVAASSDRRVLLFKMRDSFVFVDARTFGEQRRVHPVLADDALPPSATEGCTRYQYAFSPSAVVL